MNLTRIPQSDARYPLALDHYLGESAPEVITAIGNLEILNNKKKIALFCSSKCPADLIIKTSDLAKKWRDDGVTVISGFHSPVEKECLTVLLGGKQPVIFCPARSIEGMRVKKVQSKPLDEGRLLIVSLFPQKQRRMTAALAHARNRLVAALADEIFVAHASSGGKIELFCREIFPRSKPLMTFLSNSNNNLLELGARCVKTEITV
jgi:predicted Rossmann fold nucleotide-binding protein DprA/Smf involved in DNA uptake